MYMIISTNSGPLISSGDPSVRMGRIMKTLIPKLNNEKEYKKNVSSHKTFEDYGLHCLWFMTI